VIGAGGVGGYFGGRLAMAGQEVHFIARGAHLDAIRENGLRVDSIRGDFVVRPAHATDAPGEVGPVDAVIVAVKTWQVAEAATRGRPLIGPDTVVLPLLNGVDAPGELANIFGPGHVLGGLCRIVAEIAEPGHILHSAVEPSITLGELDNSRSARVRHLEQAFTEAGVRVDIAEDIEAAIWGKFMLIATWSGVGAVTRAPIGAWRDLAGTRSMAMACLEEIFALARALEVGLPGDSVATTLSYIDSVAFDATASMQRDIVAARPSELEAQTGAVVRLGAAANVPTPTHAFIYHSLQLQERAARSSGRQGGAPAAAT
jgi:2-dehydropantoate 2-reductase